MFTKKVHVFRAGPQISAQGIERNFSPADLQEVVDSYDSQVHEAPLVIGHSGDNDSTPSFGWIKRFSRQGDDLYADVEFTDAAKDLVKKGHYKKVSISFYSPESPINPHKGKWSARHLAMLGAAPPAVKGLESLSFSEPGLFDFAVKLSPEEIFDKDLGPTMILERSPLEVLKEKLDEVKGQINDSLKQLEENQEKQIESQTSETTTSAEENATPSNPSDQFNEMNKNLGREGAETLDSAKDLAESEVTTPKKKKMKATPEPEMGTEGTDSEEEFKEKAPKTKAALEPEMEDEDGGYPETEDEEFGEGIVRKTSPGGHGQEAQVVEEVFKEKKGKKAKAPPMYEDEEEEGEEEDTGETEAGDEEEEMEFDEVSQKASKAGRVTFGTHAAGRGDKVTGRSKTARSDSDSYANRQDKGEGDEEDREGITKDGSQERDRAKTSKNASQERDRDNLAKTEEGDDSENSRWAEQGQARKKVMNNDQYDDDDSDYPEKQRAGKSTGGDPHGRSGGSTKVSQLSEEDPDGMEMAVDVKNVKGSKARVLYNSAGQKRAAVKGGAIADHAEGYGDREGGEPDDEGRVTQARKAKTSAGSDARGRSGGSTKFPTKSEEEPDDMEMAVDVSDATASNKMRVVRQKSGDKPSTSYAEGERGTKSATKDPMTTTGKGSTYQEGEEETEEFCGADMVYGDMGSMAQAKPLGIAEQIYEELKSVREENARLRREFEEQKINGRKQRIAHFIENLYGEGKLTDAAIPQGELQSYCEGLEFGTLEFAEGETPSTKLLNLLSRLPNMVYFNEVVSNDKFEPEEEELDPHERALQMVKRGEASDYLEAIKMAIPWSSRG